MSPRLLRALQNGGCLAPLSGDIWGVWRRPDLRTRPIGKVDRVELGLLHMRGCLARLGVDDNPRFVWSGPRLQADAIAPSPQAACVQDKDNDRFRGKSLLYRIVMTADTQEQQSRLLQAAFDYAEDVERSLSGGQSAGMNWDRLAAGTVIDAPLHAGRSELQMHAFDVRRRLRRLAACLGQDRLALLDRLIVHNMTRHAMARHFGLGVPLVEKKASEALCALADIYDEAFSRPERVSSLPVRSGAG